MTTSDSSSSTEANERTFGAALPYTAGGSIARLPTVKDARPFTWDGPTPTFPIKGKEFFLPPGLTLISGPTGIGKTLLVHALIRASDGQLAYINLLEPFNTAAEIDASPVAYSIREAMEMASVSLEQGLVPVLDSLRILTYTSTGATGRRGINMGMFGYLTALNNTLAQAGASMMAVINPLLDEVEDYNAFISNCRSSVVSVIEVTEKARFTVSRRPDRDKAINFSYDPAYDAEIPVSPIVVHNVSAGADFPTSQSNAATRSKVRQMGANSVGQMVKGNIDLLNN